MSTASASASVTGTNIGAAPFVSRRKFEAASAPVEAVLVEAAPVEAVSTPLKNLSLESPIRNRDGTFSNRDGTPHYPIGANVEIGKLVNNTEYNGLTGSVVSSRLENGKYTVEIEVCKCKGTEMKKGNFNPINLRRTDVVDFPLDFESNTHEPVLLSTHFPNADGTFTNFDGTKHFPIGENVEFVDLVNNAVFNGCQGSVVSCRNEKTGNYKVAVQFYNDEGMETDKKTFDLSPSNLVKFEPFNAEEWYNDDDEGFDEDNDDEGFDYEGFDEDNDYEGDDEVFDDSAMIEYVKEFDSDEDHLLNDPNVLNHRDLVHYPSVLNVVKETSASSSWSPLPGNPWHES